MTDEPNTITVTLRMDDKHDVRAVRLLLKRLLRAYGLKCVALGIVSDEQEASTNGGHYQRGEM